MNLDGRRALVVGLGESGLAAVEALHELGADVTVTESRPEADVAAAATRAEAAGARVIAGGHDRAPLDHVDLAVTSPGVPGSAPILSELAGRGVELWSELELGARLARAPYVAITGTNGKTTTTEIVAEAMRNDGRDAIACGNVGYPFSRAARERRDALVVEASSFQLRFTSSLHPQVSALLNLAPDHLDWHGDVEAYADAKARIHARQRGSDVHVGNADDAHAAEVSRRAVCTTAWFSLERPDAEATFRDGSLRVRWHDGELELGAPPADGRTDRANAAAAALVATAFGVSSGAIADAIRTAEPGAHRGRVVAEVDGVRFVDDSKATNPHAALAAIDRHAPAVLIAGGLAKGVDLAPLAMAAQRLRAVVAIGEAAPTIAGIFDGLVPVRTASSIEEAVATAFSLARPRDAVLLAPACASMDMFKDYGERGDRFADAAHRLEREGRNRDG